VARGLIIAPASVASVNRTAMSPAVSVVSIPIYVRGLSSADELTPAGFN
jgi:hypothetical protein